MNGDGSYMSAEEIISDIFNARMGAKEKSYIRSMRRDDLPSLHHSFGMWIRNSYGLWSDEYPHITEGVHPDDFSFEIIEAYYELLINPPEAK